MNYSRSVSFAVIAAVSLAACKARQAGPSETLGDTSNPSAPAAPTTAAETVAVNICEGAQISQYSYARVLRATATGVVVRTSSFREVEVPTGCMAPVSRNKGLLQAHQKVVDSCTTPNAVDPWRLDVLTDKLAKISKGSKVNWVATECLRPITTAASPFAAGQRVASYCDHDTNGMPEPKIYEVVRADGVNARVKYAGKFSDLPLHCLEAASTDSTWKVGDTARIDESCREEGRADVPHWILFVTNEDAIVHIRSSTKPTISVPLSCLKAI